MTDIGWARDVLRNPDLYSVEDVQCAAQLLLRDGDGIDILTARHELHRLSTIPCRIARLAAHPIYAARIMKLSLFFIILTVASAIVLLRIYGFG